MKKELIIFVLTIIIFLATPSKGIITGEATSDNVGVSITVTTSAIPFIQILTPLNKTYLDTNISLNFTSTDASQINYSFGNGANTTITNPLYVTASSGLNTLHLWANNSIGLNHTAVTFTVNLSLLTINYTNFNGSSRGESTDFYKYPYDNLTDLSDIILENTNYGKVYFLESINVTNDLNNSDNEVDINGNLNISNNSINLNSTALPNFNKSARIYLYNLTLTNPQVLVDGSVCSSTQCTEINYSGGTFVFNVSHFTNYSARETPTDSGGSGGSSGGGGGGGGSSSVKRDLQISFEENIQIEKGTEIAIPVKIQNPENISLKEIRMAVKSGTYHLDAIFEMALIKELKSKESLETILFLRAGNESETGYYSLNITGNVTNPKFTKTIVLNVEIVEELGKNSVLKIIETTKRLFEDNPRCEKLSYLIQEAENLLNQENISQAKIKINEAISRCKDSSTMEEFPLSKNINLKLILIILIVLVLLIIAIIFFRRNKTKTLKKHK